jgi:DNA-binding transcriptional LysR family regulator
LAFKRGQLLYFVTVAEERQMTRAARKLHLAQPALSHAIAQLESELGIKLLERHPRGVTLTPAGETFLEKARDALSAMTDAALTAQALARTARDTIALGFLGSPPIVAAPQLLAAFAAAHPEIELSARELPFPRGSTAHWLEDVDIALCFSPAADPDVCFHALRAEPRAVVAPASHPLARRRQLAVAEVLDETFFGMHPAVEPVWAGFWRLDDHRGGPPAQMTADRPLNALEMFAIIASGRAITTFPASRATTIGKILRDVVAIPLRDAHSAVLSLAWGRENRNPLIEPLLAVAREFTADGPVGRLADHAWPLQPAAPAAPEASGGPAAPDGPDGP